MLWPMLMMACSKPDPDALFRAHDLDGASAAWEASHGAPLDVNHVVADVLSRRAVRDPAITAATLADTMEAVRALESAPRLGARAVELPFDRWEDLVAAAGTIGVPPVLVAIGRSELASDTDPFTGGALPWTEGRVVGWARKGAGEGNEALVALGRSLDADPPAKLVTVVLRDAGGSFALYARKEPDGWWIRWTTNAEGAAALTRAMEAGRSSAR